MNLIRNLWRRLRGDHTCRLPDCTLDAGEHDLLCPIHRDTTARQ